jgi:trigger factor
MQVSVEHTGIIGRRLKVLIPSQQIKIAVQEKMGELSKKVRVPGFRDGKAPKNVVEQRYGGQVRQEAVGKVIETSLPLALEQNDLKPAGRPLVESISGDEEKDLEYVVSFEIFPNISLVDFNQINVERYQVSVTDEEVDKTLNKVRNQFAEWVIVDREAQLGDSAVVDYTSTINGKPYESNQGQDVSVEIGSKLFIEGFEEGLLGGRAGESRILDLTFPADWRIEKLANKPVQFSISIKEIKEKHLAELDADFAKKIGAASEELSSITTKIRASMEKQVAETIQANLKEQITNELISLNPIPVPRALVEREESIMHEEMHRRMGDKGETACHHPGLGEQAEKRVALGLILNEVIKIHNIQPNENQVKDRIAELAKMFSNNEFIETMYRDSEELLSGVRHTVLLDQALELVVSKITIIDKPLTVEELFNR